MAVRLTCYGGVAEIGGSKILLEDGETRLFFDFGTSFGRQKQFFNEFLRPRAARGLLDLLALGLIPPLEGLYRPDLTTPHLWARFRTHPHYRNLQRGEGRPAVDAVLVSHAHLDHHGDLSYLDDDIPIHSSCATALTSRAMQVTGGSTFEREIAWISLRAPGESGELKSGREGSLHSRRFFLLEGECSAQAQAFWQTNPASRRAWDAQPFRPSRGSIQGLAYRWWRVDHSILGAVGFAVETSNGWIGYTGDLRFHGKYGADSWRFAQELAALHPLALLCEGTHLHAETPLSESQVVQNALSLIRQSAGKLVIADFAPRNIERLSSFLELAEQSRRALVVQPKDIYTLQAIHLADPQAFPQPDSLPHLLLYADPKAAPRPWELELRQAWSARTVHPTEVARSPGDFLLAWSLWDLNDLVDLEGICGGLYLYSNSKAYDEEQATDLERLRNWVRWMGLTLHGDPDDAQSARLHASGHASGIELLEFVRTVRPKMLIPVHTEQPQWWQEQLLGTGILVCPPQFGKPMAL